jgi:DNA repair exonuclease SbcCD ATPase subunit
MQGPITLFDSGTYAGDARIEDLPPGQDRLISYALDLKTEVEPKLEGGTQELATVSLKKGTMLISRRLVEDRTYLVKNRDAKAKTVLIEQPYRADWKLAEPKEPTERTRDLYRFSVAVDPGESATLRVKETLPIQESILLMESGIDQILHYQQAREVSLKVKESLQRVVQLRSKLDDARTQRTRLDHRTAEITAEHARIRENMQRLQQNSDLYNRYVKKLDQQETELENLRKEIERLKNMEEDHRRELQNYVMNLDVA